MKKEIPTPFQHALTAAIIATIKRMRKDGTTGASMACLKQCTPTPSPILVGAPQGGNVAWQYSQIFTRACANLPTAYNRFIIPA